MAEGFRNMDLRRWRSMDQMITQPYHVEGFNLWDEMYGLGKDGIKPVAGVSRLTARYETFLKEIIGKYLQALQNTSGVT